MAATITGYDHLWKLVTTGGVDLDTDTLKLALVTSSYTFDGAHTQWSDVSSYEVSSGSGYTTGGETIANPISTNTTIDFDDTTWTALTKTFRFVICYKLGSGGGLTNPLLFCYLPDSTPADTVSLGSNWAIQWHSINKLFYKP